VTSIIGARLLPANVHIELTANTLLAANGPAIPLEGECKIPFQVGGKEFSVYAVVTKAVQGFILGIDFLMENECQWDFRASGILLRNDWVRLRQRDTDADTRYVYVCHDCSIPGTQVESPCNFPDRPGRQIRILGSLIPQK